MGVINLSLEKIGYEAINLKSARDIPLFTTVREYYKGTGAEFANFLTNNGMSYEKNTRYARAYKQLRQGSKGYL